MHPVLLEAPGLGAINAYGTLILVGGLVAMPWAYWDIKARGLSPGRPGTMLIDLYLVLVFGAAVGGRVFHVLTAPGTYWDDPARMFAANGTGFVFFGSLAAIALGMVWLARRYDTRLSVVVDLAATWMPLAHVFGRLGCWFAGCCWGAPSTVPWAAHFGPDSVVYQLGGLADAQRPAAGTPGLSGVSAPMFDGTVGLHPVQLYESAGLLLCFAILLWFRRRRGIEAPWRQASRYAVAYGLLRLITEIFRGDVSRGLLVAVSWPALAGLLRLPAQHPVALSFSQAVSVGLVAWGLWGLRRTRS